jgi:hypothetical protein
LDPTITNVTPLAPSTQRSTSAPTAKSGSFIEQHIGAVTATAAATILEALAEHRDRGLSPAIKTQTGELFWQLYRLRQFLVPTWDFDVIARERGTAALCAADVAPAIAQIAVDEVLRVLHAVIRDNLN